MADLKREVPRDQTAPPEMSTIWRNQRRRKGRYREMLPMNQGIVSRLLLATCRDHPNDPDVHDFVPLPAGHYRLHQVERSDLAAGTNANTYTCTDMTPFITSPAIPTLPPGDVVIVIHGFSCTENGGVATIFNVAQSLAAWGLQLAAPGEIAAPGHVQVIGFTWPTDHSLVPGYMSAKESVARFAAFSLVNLLLALRGDDASPQRRIHLVAHSMGCFLALKALNTLAVLTPFAHILPLVHEVIWLAPDINADALECSTPEIVSTFQRLSERPNLAKGIAQHVARLRPLSERQQTFQQTHLPSGGTPEPLESQRAIDGYGYAALNAMRRLSIYCSLRDEAMWVSPLANQGTEEAGAIGGSVRLGWCGPLHPGLMMIPDTSGDLRTVILNDCSSIVGEHGDYFYHPVTQRDVALRLREGQQDATLLGESPFIERQHLMQWHRHTPYAYPSQEEWPAPGLEMDQLVAFPSGTVGATTRNPQAPYRNAGPTAPARFPASPRELFLSRLAALHDGQ